MNSDNIKEKFTIQADEDINNIRIDKFISDKIDSLTRAKVKTLIDSQMVFSSKKSKITGKEKVTPGEILEVHIPAPKPQNLVGKKIPFQVVFEDDHLAVIDKPSGVTVHPGAGTGEDTLVHGLIYHFGNNLSDIGGETRPGIVHRLDKNTSGLMLIAKNNECHLKLSTMLSDHLIDRIYHAVVLNIPKPANGTIDKNISRSNLDWKKMGVTVSGGKKAITHYKTMEIFQNGNASLVECKLETGRTHQIRVHFSHSGFPILGDPEYGNFRKIKLSNLGRDVCDHLAKMNRQALHAVNIEFNHPISSEKLIFQSPIADDINELINLLKK